MPSACFSAIDKDQRIGNMPKAKALKKSARGAILAFFFADYIWALSTFNNR